MYYYKISPDKDIDELEPGEQDKFKYNGLDILIPIHERGVPLIYNIYFTRSALFFWYVIHHTGMTLDGNNSWINVPIANGGKYEYKKG